MTIVARHKPPDSRLERRIITAMITNDNYLRQVQEIYRNNSLRLKYTQIIAKWCIEYYTEFKKSPQRHIEDLFHKKTKVNFPKEQADEIEDFLVGISSEFEKEGNTLNVDFLLQETEQHFRLCSLDSLKVDLSKSCVSGNVEQGEALVGGYERVVRQQNKGVEPLKDHQAVIDAFSEDEGDVILRLPGALGNLIGDLERQYLVCLVGNTGIGKTWWLLQLAWWATLRGYDVLFVSYEMNIKKLTVRTYQWATGLVIPKHAGIIHKPVWDCFRNQIGDCSLRERENTIKLFDVNNETMPHPTDYPSGYSPCIACKGKYKQYDPTSFLVGEERKPLTVEKALNSQNKFKKFYARAGKLKFVQFPAGSQSIDDLRLFMQNLYDYEDFLPDMLLTDYAKKMKPNRYSGEKRHDIVDIFVDHKGLAQEKNLLAITGHQGNTIRDGKDLKQGNWADAVGGLHECDVSMLINQKTEEKRNQIYRVSPGKVRDDEFDAAGQAMVLSCLKIGRPYLDSFKMY